jgi:hypothetical protein
MTGAAATGAQDAWAAGSVYDNGDAQPQVRVEQWDGAGWQRVSLPSSVTSTVHGAGNAVVGASSSSNAWVFVQGNGTGKQSSVDYTYALDWNGSTWTSQRFAAWGLTTATEVFSPTNAWAFGVQIEKNIVPYNLHYNGKTWAKVTLPGTVDGVSATSASNMWAFGTKGTTAIVMHWNGTTWSTLALPKLSLPPGDSLTPGTIATLSPTDVWVASGLAGGAGVASGYVLLHWNGTTWQQVTIPYTPFSVGYLTQDGDGGIWLSAYTDDGLHQYLYHDSASGTWSEQQVPTEAGISQQQVNALAWIPGTTSEVGGGTLVASDGSSQGAILQYTGS